MLGPGAPGAGWAARATAIPQGTVDWPVYLGDSGSTHYSRLGQIDARNVTRLEVAWTYRGGWSDPQNRSQIQCNPLVIDGVVYGTTADLKLFALDATSGVQKWRFDPAACDGITKGASTAAWPTGPMAPTGASSTPTTTSSTPSTR